MEFETDKTLIEVVPRNWCLVDSIKASSIIKAKRCSHFIQSFHKDEQVSIYIQA